MFLGVHLLIVFLEVGDIFRMGQILLSSICTEIRIAMTSNGTRITYYRRGIFDISVSYVILLGYITGRYSLLKMVNFIFVLIVVMVSRTKLRIDHHG